MHRKAIKWLLNLLDNDDLHKLEIKYKVVIPGYRTNQAPREKLIQAIALSKALPRIVKDLKKLLSTDITTYDVLSEIEVTRLMQETDTNIPSLVLTLAFHADPTYQILAEIVIEEIDKRGGDEYANFLRTNHIIEVEEKRSNHAKRVEVREEEQATKLAKASETIVKLRQQLKIERGKEEAKAEKFSTEIKLLSEENEGLKKRNLTLEESLKQKDQTNQSLIKNNNDLAELIRCLKQDIKHLEKQLVELKSATQEVSVTNSSRAILIGGRTVETLAQSSSVEFLPEEKLIQLEEGFFDEYDRILIPLYNSTTMTQIKLSQLAYQKVILFGTHIELGHYLKGVI